MIGLIVVSLGYVTGRDNGYMDCSQVQFWVHEGIAPQSECAPINLSELKELFNAGAFWARDRHENELAIAIRNSHPVVSAWDRDRLIGFARAISDGIYRATIWDVVIHPDYQGAGLGRRLVETVVMHPHVDRAERIYLMTSNQQKFYERIGFEENKTTTMVLFNRVIYREELAAITETIAER